MNRVSPRLYIVLAASAAALAAATPAFADPQPVPPPPAPGPQPAPYPDGPETLPPPPCEHTICLPQPGATQAAAEQPPPPEKPVHKHIAGVKYEDFAKSGTVSDSAAMDAAQIQAVDLSFGDIEGTGTVHSADPMEGGQIARSKAAAPQMQDTTVYSADPMEGGQIAAPHYRPGRQKPGNITAVNPQVEGTTVYSADPMEGGQVTARKYTPGKPTYGNATFEGSGVAKKKTATFKTLMGACTNGVHIKEAIITTRSGSVTLHDAMVVSVTPADPVDGQPMEEVTITYASADQ